MEKKRCTKCDDKKSIKEFSKDKYTKDGFRCWCKKCMSQHFKQYSENNKKKIREFWNKWRKENPEKIKIHQKKFHTAHKKERNEYQKKRRKNDPILRLNHSMKVVIRQSLKGNKNGHHWESLVNYDTQQLKEHLEGQFKDGMTWQNYGKDGWVIDHRIPISLFNIKGIKSKGFKACWKLENLHPMWEKENKEKSNKILY